MGIIEIKLADFGEGLHEAEILEWHVKPGDKVKIDQTLLEVHTEKVSDDIASSVNGVIKELKCEEGDVVKVGAVLCTIEVEGDTPVKEEKDDSLFTVAPDMQFKRISSKNEMRETTPMNHSQNVVNERVLAAPAVRRRAREMGIDLRFVRGSAKGGRITAQDLMNYTSSTPEVVSRPKVVPGNETRIALKGTRRTIANAMRNSMDTAAHITLFDEVDMANLTDLRTQLKPLMEEKGIKITYVALAMKALVPALRKHPMLNGSIDGNEIVLRDYYNIGISVDTPDGLMVPVVKNVEQKSVWEVASEVIDLANRARIGKLKLHEMQGGTFTITSVGSIGTITNATPIIPTPQSGIFGMMRTKMKPVAIEENGEWVVKVRPIMNVCLSVDHRLIDGAEAIRFMNEVIANLQQPYRFLLE